MDTSAPPHPGLGGTHLPFIDAERIAIRLKEEQQSLFSTLCHRTRMDHLEGIFENGLLSGVSSGKSCRTMAFLSGFVSGDARNLAAGRQKEPYGVEIIFDTRAVFENYEVWLGTNGCLMVGRIPQEHIAMIYVLNHFDGSMMPLETTLDERGRYRELNRGEINPKADLTRWRHIVLPGIRLREHNAPALSVRAPCHRCGGSNAVGRSQDDRQIR